MKIKKITLLVFLLCTIIILSVNNLYAKTVLFHVKTSLEIDDAQICVMPNMALASITSGDKVIIIFDASAVTSVSKGWGTFNFSGRSPMYKAALPERERLTLAKQFAIPIKEIPKNYGEYLELLIKKGAKLYINNTMLKLYKIDLNKIDINIKTLELKDMLKLFKKSDLIIVY